MSLRIVSAVCRLPCLTVPSVCSLLLQISLSLISAPPPPCVAMSVPFFAKALFDYEAVESSELTVVAGDFLTVEEVNESGWCLVRSHCSTAQQDWTVESSAVER